MSNVVEGVSENIKEEPKMVKVQAYIPEPEYQAFLEALKKCGRYTSISDAIRDFIRDFNDRTGVKVRASRLRCGGAVNGWRAGNQA